MKFYILEKCIINTLYLKNKILEIFYILLS